MTLAERDFGQSASIQFLIESGEEYFNAINQIDIAEVLTRARRISKIARAATQLTGERLKSADSQPEGLISDAYKNIADITARILPELEPDFAEELLTSGQTHQTLLLISKSLTARQMNRFTKNFRKHGTGLLLADAGLVLHPDYELPKKDKEIGCPFAKGNSEKSALFIESTDNIVRTYTQAYRQGMPKNLIDQLTRQD